MTTIFLPRQIAINGTGAAYSGSMLNLHLTGTPTPKTIFSDTAFNAPDGE